MRIHATALRRRRSPRHPSSSGARASFTALVLCGALAILPANLAAHADVAAPAAPATAAAGPAPATPVPLHPDVQRALAYTVPETSCVKPEVGLGNHSAGRFERVQRAQKRYVKCLEGYQQQLFGDFEFLRDSVRHGVSRSQADAIGANLRSVHERIKTVQSQGAVITQDQARIITTMMSGNRAMPGAENH